MSIRDITHLLHPYPETKKTTDYELPLEYRPPLFYSVPDYQISSDSLGTLPYKSLCSEADSLEFSKYYIHAEGEKKVFCIKCNGVLPPKQGYDDWIEKKGEENRGLCVDCAPVPLTQVCKYCGQDRGNEFFGRAYGTDNGLTVSCVTCNYSFPKCNMHPEPEEVSSFVFYKDNDLFKDIPPEGSDEAEKLRRNLENLKNLNLFNTS